MSRPDQLLMVTLAYTLGATIAVGRGVPLARFEYGAGLVALLPVAASIHLANEYADYETDRRTVRTRFSGGSGALVELDLPRWLPLAVACGTLPIGLLVGVIWLPRLLDVGLLLLGATLGWMYSLPPLALAWRGLGEIDNALLGGTGLPLYGYAVQVGRIDLGLILIVMPFTLVVFVNLLDTTWPDRQADAAVGKRTLATRWSPDRLRLLYGLTATIAFALLVPLAWVAVPVQVAVASLIALPFIVWGWLRYTRTRSPFPTVAGMVLLAIVQTLGWARTGGIL